MGKANVQCTVTGQYRGSSAHSDAWYWFGISVPLSARLTVTWCGIVFKRIAHIVSNFSAPGTAISLAFFSKPRRYKIPTVTTYDPHGIGTFLRFRPKPPYVTETVRDSPRLQWIANIESERYPVDRRRFDDPEWHWKAELEGPNFPVGSRHVCSSRLTNNDKIRHGNPYVREGAFRSAMLPSQHQHRDPALQIFGTATHADAVWLRTTEFGMVIPIYTLSAAFMRTQSICFKLLTICPRSIHHAPYIKNDKLCVCER